jgi:hypothetical protein
LRSELGTPVEGTSGTLGFVVELVQGLDHDVLVGPGGALQYGIDFCTDDEVKRFLVLLKRQVEASVLVGLGSQRFGLPQW